MRRYAIAGLCLLGGLAWVVSLSFLASGPAAKPNVTLPLPVAAEPIQGSPAPQAVQVAQAPQASTEPAPAVSEAAVAAPADPVFESKSGEDITAEIKAAAEANAAAAAQPETTASIDRPAVQASLEPAVKPDEVVAPPAAPPDAKPTDTPAALPPAQLAQGCPGNPDAIGTSRVLTISPADYGLLGTLQYKQTLPLKDHEVVLTFDDGPIPPYTNSILDILAANCVKATYFLVGEMAGPRPYLVRRIYNEGHSIGTHSQHHPFAFQRLSMQRVEREVDGGIDSVTAALGDPKALSPFFRIPGFGRTNAIDQYLEGKKLVVWSTDIDTDDWWRGSTPGAIVGRAMRQLANKGRGIILMHDIHPATVLALPLLLKELKANGYRVVHVAAAGEQPKLLPEVVASAAEKQAWPRVLHADTEKRSPTKAALRHRVKLALDHRRHRRGARQEAGEISYKNTSAADERLTRSY